MSATQATPKLVAANEELFMEAVKAFDLEGLRALKNEPLPISKEWIYNACSFWVWNYPPTHPNPIQIAQGLDVILHEVARSAPDIVEHIRTGGPLFAGVLQTGTIEAEDWAVRNKLILNTHSKWLWIDAAIRKLNSIDLMGQMKMRVDTEWKGEFQGYLVALSVLRGDDAQVISKIADMCPLADTYSVARSIASVLYRRMGDEELVKTSTIQPTMDGLAWLGRKCPGKALKEGAEAIMMDDECYDVLIKPLRRQCQIAIEHQALKTQTPQATAKRPGQRL